MTPLDPRAVRKWWGWWREIRRRGAEYMERYSIRPQYESGHNAYRAYINHFLAPDDPGHHDHPWTWALSIILWGSYTEEILVRPEDDYGHKMYDAEYRADGTVVLPRHVRWFNWIRPGVYHRIAELHPSRFGGRGVVTLFLCGGLHGRGWGWWKPGIGHVPYSPK